MIKNINDKVLDIIYETAEKIILPSFNKLKKDEIKTKSNEEDFVTKIDIASEEFLTKNLSKLLPKSLVVGEETAFYNKDFRKIFDTDSLVWVVDPLDGTINFINARDDFGIIVSLVSKKEAIGGWIFKPITKQLIQTEKSAGTFNEKNEKILINNDNYQLENLKGVVYAITDKMTAKVPNISWTGCSAGCYTNFLNQKLDFLISGPTNLNSWDHLTGVLAIKEAGAFAKLHDETEYNLTKDMGHLICAKSQKMWYDLKKLV